MPKIENTSWIKLYRKIFDNPYMNKSSYLSVWIWILTHAEHGLKLVDGVWVNKEETEMPSVIWRGNRKFLKKGEFTFGAYRIAKDTGVSRGTVERIIKVFKSEEQIEVQTSSKYSLGFVKNWEKYQSIEERNEEQMRNKRGTSEEVTKNIRIKDILSKDNRQNAGGNVLVKRILDNFEERFEFKPTDKKPNYEAWNLVRRIKSLLKEMGRETTDEKVLSVIDKYFSWLDSQDWFEKCQGIGVLRLKFEIYKSLVTKNVQKTN